MVTRCKIEPLGQGMKPVAMHGDTAISTKRIYIFTIVALMFKCSMPLRPQYFSLIIHFSGTIHSMLHTSIP